MLRDFRKFILRGNIADLVIGFTVGATFSTLAKSFVDDVLMPPVGLLMGQADFSDLFVVIKSGTVPPPYQTLAQAKEAGAVTINYGNFLNHIVSLLIVGFAVYILIKFMNKLNEELDDLPLVGEKKKLPQEPALKKCPFCLNTIPYRAVKCGFCTIDLLKLQKKNRV
jgi:large conductance mechanosensitive channel